MTHDRVQKREFPLTHEFLAYMLGARMGGVHRRAHFGQSGSDQLHTRQYSRRKRLEKASCECYGIIKDEYDRLLSSGRY